jgi:hypothetical protein
MRWSKLILSFGILSAAGLMGCRQEGSTKSGPVNQGTSQYQQTQHSEQTTMQNRSTTGPRADDGTKVAIATPTQCYADLCQSNHELSLLELMSKAEKGTAEQRKYYEKHINPLVIESMKRRATSERAVVSMLQRYKGEFENLKLNDVQRRLVTAMYYLMKPALLDVPARARIDKIIAGLPYSKAIYASRMKGASGYFEAMNPGMGVQKSAQQEAQYIKSIQQKFNEVSELNIVSVQFPALTRALKGEELNREDLAAIGTKGAYLRKLESLLTGEAHEELDKLGYTEADFYQTYKNAKLEKRYNDIQDFKAVDSAKCESSFYQSINLAPQVEEVKKFDIVKDQVKKASLSLLNKSDAAYAVVEKTDFFLPYNSTESVGLWGAAFKEDIRSSTAEVQRVTQYGVREAYVMAVTNALVNNSDTLLCDGMYDPGLIDSITPEDGVSRLSWMTVRYPQYGISVLAHEIGHVVYKHSKDFSAQIACIKEQNGSDKYTAEDFADLLAIKTEKSLADLGVDLNGKKANVGCLFASLRVGEGLTNTTPEDNHSSHLFRALKFALYRKQDLPVSCKALARTEKSNVLTSCDN